MINAARNEEETPKQHQWLCCEAGKPDGAGYTLLRVGPYTQTWLASRDADRLNAELAGRAATVIPGFIVVAKDAPFDVSDHERYIDPYDTDVVAQPLCDDPGVQLCPGTGPTRITSKSPVN